MDPKKRASPNEKIPPSAATIQYPRPSGVGTRWLIGALSTAPAIEP